MVFSLIVGGAAAGCGASNGPEPVEPPQFVPAEAAQKALADYDQNKDGFLDLPELEKCPALKNALKELDTNRDGQISAEELTDRLEKFAKTKVGLVNQTCTVYKDGQPLAGATVTLVPEKFLGSGFRAAAGVSDKDGRVTLQVAGEANPAVPWGYFRIEVSVKNADGQEQVPAQYNSQTTLGQEISPFRRRPPIELHLSGF